MQSQEVNWAGNHVYAAERLVRPRTIDELCAVVAGTDQVRALGSRHSFSDLADTEGTLVSLLDLPADIEIDADAATVRVSAGVTYGHLSTELHHAGWALPSMASLPHITVAGAVATGTHGSGDRLGSLATAVRAVELVGPGGELRRVASGDPAFDGHVVALGALGVVTHVTLAIEPTFEIRQDVLVGLAWDDLTGHLDTIMGSTYSVSVFTDWVSPEANQVWLKSRAADRPDVTGALARSLPATAPTHMLPGGEVEALTVQLGETGPWHERLPHFRMEFTPSRGAELQSEYFVARRHAPAACEALLGLGGRLAPPAPGLRDPFHRGRPAVAERGVRRGRGRSPLHLGARPSRCRGGAAPDRGGAPPLRCPAALGQGLHHVVVEAARGAPTAGRLHAAARRDRPGREVRQRLPAAVPGPVAVSCWRPRRGPWRGGAARCARTGGASRGSTAGSCGDRSSCAAPRSTSGSRVGH